MIVAVLVAIGVLVVVVRLLFCGCCLLSLKQNLKMPIKQNNCGCTTGTLKPSHHLLSKEGRRAISLGARSEVCALRHKEKRGWEG